MDNNIFVILGNHFKILNDMIRLILNEFDCTYIIMIAL